MPITVEMIPVNIAVSYISLKTRFMSVCIEFLWRIRGCTLIPQMCT